MTEVIYTGNAAANTADRGWMLGHFMADGDARRSDDVEVKWGLHPEGETRQEWSPDDGRSTLSVLISGRFRIDFPDRAVVLATQGDYVLYRGVSHTWQSERASVVLVIRWPSLQKLPEQDEPGILHDTQVPARIPSMTTSCGNVTERCLAVARLCRLFFRQLPRESPAHQALAVAQGRT